MAFPTDWVVSKQNGSTGVDLDGSSPIIAGGSLFIDAVMSPERVSLYNNTYAFGQTAGLIRSIVQVAALTTTGTERVGFAFMQNSPTLYGPADMGYGAFMSGTNGFGSPRIAIVKFTIGLPSTPTELAFTTSFIAPTLGSNFVFEVQWAADLGMYGGTLITVRYGTGTSFGSLADVLTFTDTSSPIITSAYESLAFSFFGTGHFRTLFDETYIYQAI